MESGSSCICPLRTRLPVQHCTQTRQNPHQHSPCLFFSVVFVFFPPSHPLFSCISFHDKQEIHEYMEWYSEKRRRGVDRGVRWRKRSWTVKAEDWSETGRELCRQEDANTHPHAWLWRHTHAHTRAHKQIQSQTFTHMHTATHCRRTGGPSAVWQEAASPQSSRYVWRWWWWWWLRLLACWSLSSSRSPGPSCCSRSSSVERRARPF